MNIIEYDAHRYYPNVLFWLHVTSIDSIIIIEF
jgi:hypothetical protein